MSPRTCVALLLSPVLISCAAVAPAPRVAPRPEASAALADRAREPLAAPVGIEGAGSVRSDRDAVMPTMPGERLVGGESGYTKLKVGPFYGRGDLSDLDTGLWAEVVFGRQIIPLLSIEGMVGYVTADAGSGPAAIDIWGIPVMAQARVSVPIAILELYGGVGAGGMYVDARAGSLYDTTDFVLAGDAFAGAEIGIGRLAVGLEGKYLITDEVDSRFKFEGASGMLLVSLPF